MGSFLIFKNIVKNIIPRRALKNKIKKTLVSDDIYLIKVSWNATALIPTMIKILAFGVFSFIFIIYNWK